MVVAGVFDRNAESKQRLQPSRPDSQFIQIAALQNRPGDLTFDQPLLKAIQLECAAVVNAKTSRSNTVRCCPVPAKKHLSATVRFTVSKSCSVLRAFLTSGIRESLSLSLLNSDKGTEATYTGAP